MNRRNFIRGAASFVAALTASVGLARRDKQTDELPSCNTSPSRVGPAVDGEIRSVKSIGDATVIVDTNPVTTIRQGETGMFAYDGEQKRWIFLGKCKDTTFRLSYPQ